MKLEHLYYYLTVADCGSITTASQKLFLKRSNLSAVLSNLEKEFDTSLFIRSSKGIVLTPNGEKVYAWAKSTLTGQEALIHEFSKTTNDLPSGNLFIYTTPAISGSSYASFFSQFLNKYPSITLHYRESNLSTIVDILKENINVIALPVTNSKNLTLLDAEPALSYLLLTEPTLLAYVAKSSPWATKFPNITLKDLAALPLLLYSPFSSECQPVLSDFLENKHNFNHLTSVSNLSLFHELLETGNYFTIGTTISTLSNDMEKLIPIPILDPVKLSHIILFNKESAEKPTLSNFITSYQNAVTQYINVY